MKMDRYVTAFIALTLAFVLLIADPGGVMAFTVSDNAADVEFDASSETIEEYESDSEGTGAISNAIEDGEELEVAGDANAEQESPIIAEGVADITKELKIEVNRYIPISVYNQKFKMDADGGFNIDPSYFVTVSDSTNDNYIWHKDYQYSIARRTDWGYAGFAVTMYENTRYYDSKHSISIGVPARSGYDLTVYDIVNYNTVVRTPDPEHDDISGLLGNWMLSGLADDPDGKLAPGSVYDYEVRKSQDQQTGEWYAYIVIKEKEGQERYGFPEGNWKYKLWDNEMRSSSIVIKQDSSPAPSQEEKKEEKEEQKDGPQKEDASTGLPADSAGAEKDEDLRTITAIWGGYTATVSMNASVPGATSKGAVTGGLNVRLSASGPGGEKCGILIKKVSAKKPKRGSSKVTIKLKGSAKMEKKAASKMNKMLKNIVISTVQEQATDTSAGSGG